MPRGEDTSRHEGRKVHRDTPRIASMLADHLNNRVVYPIAEHIDNLREGLGSYGAFGNDEVLDIADNLPGYVKEYTPDSAQNLLNDYRTLRDRASRPYAPQNEWLRNLDQASVADYQDDLKGIIRNR